MEKYHENKTPRDEEYVRAYQQTKSQIKAAALCGVGRETIARAVRRAGIPLNGNRTPKKITDEQLIEYCKYLTVNEIAEKAGMHCSSLPRRFKRLGINPKGYGLRKSLRKHNDNPKHRKGIWTVGDPWHYVKTRDEYFRNNYQGFVYLESRTHARKDRIKCLNCGGVFERHFNTVWRNGVNCSHCEEQARKEKELLDARVTFLKFLCAFAENEKPKQCSYCGNVFYSQYPNKKYCSDRCKDRAKKRSGVSIRNRCRKYGVYYDPTVTSERVFERDRYICQICGLVCDPSDKSWGTLGPYAPTVDHILALANGGTHTWGNVQCAHAICNSYKRDLITVKREEART